MCGFEDCWKLVKKFCCQGPSISAATWFGKVSNPDFLNVPSLFLIKDFFMVIVTEKGDSTKLKFKFEVLMLLRMFSQVWWASILVYLNF